MSAAAFVIKSWKASHQPDVNQNYIEISGRAAGLFAWILNSLGISPTVRFLVREDKVMFQKGSLEGTLNVITPLENLCSTFYAFRRPWKEAVFLGIVVGLVTIALFAIPGILVALLYYALNKTLSIGFTDVGGRIYEIPFKRSVIEGRNLDETEAARACDLMQSLVEARRERTLALADSR